MLFREGRIHQEGLSESLQELFGNALESAVESRRARIRTGHLLIACAELPSLAESFSESLRGQSLERLVQALRGLLYLGSERPLPVLNLLETDFTPRRERLSKTWKRWRRRRRRPLSRG